MYALANGTFALCLAGGSFSLWWMYHLCQCFYCKTCRVISWARVASFICNHYNHCPHSVVTKVIILRLHASGSGGRNCWPPNCNKRFLLGGGAAWRLAMQQWDRDRSFALEFHWQTCSSRFKPTLPNVRIQFMSLIIGIPHRTRHTTLALASPGFWFYNTLVV